MATHNSISLFTNLFCKPKMAVKLRTQRLVQTEVKIPSMYLKSLGLLQYRMINENSKSESACKNGSEKNLYPMRHYAFGRSYNHAIRIVSDFESRYFVAIMQCAILPRLNTTIKAVKGHLRDSIQTLNGKLSNHSDKRMLSTSLHSQDIVRTPREKSRES